MGHGTWVATFNMDYRYTVYGRYHKVSGAPARGRWSCRLLQHVHSVLRVPWSTTSLMGVIVLIIQWLENAGEVGAREVLIRHGDLCLIFQHNCFLK